ncbi:MAG: tyrosine-type recombinase/integrase [Gemmiger formicilis]|uniref:tyrosine-type recombinase/integrase n=1 Tax=Gemmiger formicilis TaxID=745368 RepID=UPI0039A24666
MEDEKLADKLLDRILMVLMPYDQIDVERIKAKLTVVLDDYQICPKQEALVVYTEGKNDYYLRKFLLAKAVAGRQERTLRQYKDEVGRALRGIGKDADTITADDIQVYLAKVLSRGGSKCYCDNIRRDLSSFYNWLYREEIIRTNPMNKIDNIKFKREKEKALTDMEIEVMRQACQTTMQKAIMEMLLSTGCRAAELVSIKIADMDEDKVSILGKGGNWGDGAPEPTVWQARLLPRSRAEMQTTMTMLVEALNCRIRQVGYDPALEDHWNQYWQRTTCLHWDDLKHCTAGCTDCDSCAEYKKIPPQYCARCGATFYERKENTFCLQCRFDRKKQAQRHWCRVNAKRGERP